MLPKNAEEVGAIVEFSGNDGDSSAFKLLLSCPSGLFSSQVLVVFNELYDRIPHPNIELENSISEIWNQRTQHMPSLFNGNKFRYGGYEFYDGVGSRQEFHVSLHIGLTDYRAFVGTNLSPLWERFLAPSEDHCIKCQHTSSPLGNGAIVETSDKKIVLLQRSDNVGEFPGFYVFPGGHPEPQEVEVISHLRKDVKTSEIINRKVALEMFNSIVREVVEEVGVPAETLCNPVFIGISCRVLNVRPTAFFFMRCTLHSNDIQNHYSCAQDGYESTQLYTVSKDNLESMTSKMPGCHAGGFELYKLMLEAQNDANCK